MQAKGKKKSNQVVGAGQSSRVERVRSWNDWCAVWKVAGEGCKLCHVRFINYIDKTVKESGLSEKIRKEGLNLDIYSVLMIWSFLEVRGVTCRSHLINLMTIGGDRIKKSKDKTLSMLAIAKPVALLSKFANDCRCCLEIKHRLQRTGLPSSD